MTAAHQIDIPGSQHIMGMLRDRRRCILGKIDTITKDYMKKNAVFADAFNYFVYGGRQVIKAENLRELDTTELAIPFGNRNEAAVQKFRDLLKAAILMEDDKAAYLILGVENESDVRYAEPVKTILYDSLQYSKQVQQTAARHREAKDRKGHNNGEFLSGFYREDKLTPVVTLVILFSSEEWDGPRTLHEMMSTQDPEILNYAADYRLNLIEPAEMSTEDLARLRSSLRAVLGFIKYSNDGDALDAFLASESSLRSLDVEAARVIKMCAKTEIEFDENAEVIDVCKAEQQMKEKAKREGMIEGLTEGLIEGERKGRLETLCETIKNVMESLHLTVDEAMKIMKVAAEDQAILRKMI